jgi:hypothetical protein
MLRSSLTILLGAGLVLLIGCDSNDPGLPDSFGPGQGGITVTGGVTSSFSGIAFWSVFDDGDGGPDFGLIILNGTFEDLENPQFEGVIVTGYAERPTSGTHQLFDFTDGEGDEYEAVYVRSTSAAGTFVTSESGSMIITTSNAQRLEGTLSFTGTPFTFQGPLSSAATVTGGFNAQFIDESEFPDDDLLAGLASELLRAHAR